MNILSLFDGISIAQQALKNAGINVERYYASEIDKYAISITQKNFPNTIQLGDIQKLNWDDKEKRFESGGLLLGHKTGNIDLIVGGSPCFVAGTKIMTSNGYVNIENLNVGDSVLTHKKRYKKIEKVGNKQEKTCIVYAQGFLPITTTEEHPFYVRSMNRQWENKERKYKRIFSEPQWKQAKDLKQGDFLALPILENGKDVIDEVDAWLLGRYVADGYLRCGKRLGRKNSNHHLITFCIGKNKTGGFIK